MLKNRSILSAALLSVLLASTSGCGELMYFFWPFGRTVTIPAEFDGLKDRTTAVVVFASESTLFEYPQVTLNLSSTVSNMLRENVENAKLVDPMKVTAYQTKNMHWANLDRTELGKALKADFVMFISLVEFSTVEEGYVDLLRGRINGEAKVFDCSKPEGESLVWTCPNITIQHPKSPTVRNSRNEAAIRHIVLTKFSDELTKKFYLHKVDR